MSPFGATTEAFIAGLHIADGDSFVSRSVPSLALTLAGLAGDRHAGMTRRADARTPWHRRGMVIANTRQLSIVSVEECAAIAALLDVDVVDPALLGANVVVQGISGLSLMGAGSRIQAPSGATVFITEANAPCRHPADKLAAAFGRPRLAAAFARAAIGRRGVVGIVEREGAIGVGDTLGVWRSPAWVASPKLPDPPRPDAVSQAM